MASKTNHGKGHGADHGHHITSQGKLLATFGALFVLMALTIGAAQYMPEPIHSNTMLMNLIAITIAVVKATLVVAIFMGVKYTTKLVKLYAIGGFVWFGLMFITMMDYWARPWEPVKGWESYDATGLPRDVDRSEGLDGEKMRGDFSTPGSKRGTGAAH
jgi:caa(3)-type oxidase subunit IV